MTSDWRKFATKWRSKWIRLFPISIFNLVLVQAINNDIVAAAITLAKYKELFPKEEARNLDELLQNLRETLASAAESRFS